MEMGKDLTPLSVRLVSSVHLRKTDDWVGDKVIPFYCRRCGYIELYREILDKKD